MFFMFMPILGVPLQASAFDAERAGSLAVTDPTPGSTNIAGKWGPRIEDAFPIETGDIRLLC